MNQNAVTLVQASWGQPAAAVAIRQHAAERRRQRRRAVVGLDSNRRRSVQAPCATSGGAAV